MPSSPMPTMDSQRATAAGSGMTGSARHAHPHSRRHRGGATSGDDGSPARADLAVTLSLAGRTAHPLPQPVPVRSGGFGGVDGLADYLRGEHVDVLIDATHPYAAVMSANAAQAARRRRRRCSRSGGRPGPRSAATLDRGAEHRRRGGGAGQGAAPRIPRARPQRAPALRCSAAARLSDPQRRSGRAAACGSRATTSPHADRSPKPTIARCSAPPVSRRWSPRTAAAMPPTARSRRRGRFVCRRHAATSAAAGGADCRDGPRGHVVARSCAHRRHRARRVDQGALALGPRTRNRTDCVRFLFARSRPRLDGQKWGGRAGV